MVGVEILQQNQPYYIPGYTGYCPQNRFVCGDTYANASHELFLDPTVSHAKKLALVDNTKHQEVTKPSRHDTEIVNSRLKNKDPIYKVSMLSSYDGFIPNQDQLRDKPFGIQATQGIAAFERQQLKKKASRDCLRKIFELQRSARPMKNSDEHLLLHSKYRLPLTELQPHRIGIEKNYFVDEKYDKSTDCKTSPYFMENSNPQKFFISGYTGYVPNSHVHFGKPFKKMSAAGLQDFTSHYLNKKKIEWAPVTLHSKKQELTAPVKTYQIHLKDTALMPSYTGHVPGAKHEVGKTFGYTSKGANQYIHDQLFSLKSKNCYNKKQITRK